MRGLILRCGLLLTGLAAFFAGGCSTVAIKQPLSEPAAVDKDKFEGTWVLDDSAVQLRFSEDGVAQLASVQWEDGKFRLNRMETIFTKRKEANYLSLRGEEDGKWQPQYLFAEYTLTSQGDLVVWMPRAEWFAEAVGAGKLEGTVKKQKYSQNVVITSPPEKLLEVLEDPANAQAFNYKKPLVLRKLGSAAKAAEAPAEN